MRIFVLLLACAAWLACAGCGNTEPSVPDAGAQLPGGGIVAACPAEDGGAAETCHNLASLGPAVGEVVELSASPAHPGCTMSDGTYQLTNWTTHRTGRQAAPT